jgi:hypothetical protein
MAKILCLSDIPLLKHDVTDYIPGTTDTYSETGTYQLQVETQYDTFWSNIYDFQLISVHR